MLGKYDRAKVQTHASLLVFTIQLVLGLHNSALSHGFFSPAVKWRNIKVRANAEYIVEKITGEVLPGFGLYPVQLQQCH